MKVNTQLTPVEKSEWVFNSLSNNNILPIGTASADKSDNKLI